jgi:hypothetical protein
MATELKLRASCRSNEVLEQVPRCDIKKCTGEFRPKDGKGGMPVAKCG